MSRFFNYLCFSVIALLSVYVAGAQNVTTVAGNHSSGYSGDGGSATAATIYSPSGITITSSGVIYFCDQANNRVRMITATGIISTVAGTGVAGNAGDGGMATAAQMDNPSGVAVDASGNVYIADYNNARVRKVNTLGIISNVAGTGAAGYSADGSAASSSAISKPGGLAIDGAGNIYLSEQNNHIIRKINSAGFLSTVAGNRTSSFSGDGGAATAASISYPCTLIIDAAGNLVFADAGNSRIRKVTTAGIISTIAGNGLMGYSGDGGVATSASFNNITGLAYDASGNLLIADQNNQRVRQMSTANVITTIAGTGVGNYTGDGGPATACTMYRPAGIAVYSGATYFADMGNSAIRKIATVSHSPMFNNGLSQAMAACVSTSYALVSALAISDIDSGQTETWTVISTAGHGSLTGFPKTATSTAGVVTPTGIAYVPTTGYTGSDSFRIQVSDGTNTTSTLVMVTVSPVPNAGAITGVNKFCYGSTTSFSSTVSGGLWSLSASAPATINASTGMVGGIVGGAHTGTFIISYTVSNGCGSASSTKADTIIDVPTVAYITGATTLAIGATTTLADSTLSGIWTSNATSIGTINTAGMVTGVSNGTLTISYTITNLCGSIVTTKTMIIGTVATPVIYDFAGSATATPAYTADGALANARAITSPSGLAKDKYGNIYFSEQGNNLVRKVDKHTGALTTIAGNTTAGYSGDGGAATAAKINVPAGVAVDKAGNVYIADQYNARIRKVSTSGIITTIAGTGTIGFSADGSTAATSNIARPTGVAVDTSGNVYFAEQNNHRVRKISTTGILSTLAGNGIATYTGDGGAATAASVSYPSGIYWDTYTGNFYVADAGNNVIRKINASGAISTFAGGGSSIADGVAATAASLYNPNAVTTDGAGNLYIADRNYSAVRKVTPEGVVYTMAGTYTPSPYAPVNGFNGNGIIATTASLYYPEGIVYDSGNLYFSDYSNNEVRVIGTVSYAPVSTVPVLSYPTLALPLCNNGTAKRLDTLLTATDASGLTETWRVRRAPAHGTLTGFPYSTTSASGAMIPTNLFYTATAGYVGNDSFYITAWNGHDSASTKIYVNEVVTPVVTPIVGASAVTVGGTITLTDATPGGVWDPGNMYIANVSSTGVVTGVGTGLVTASYTISNTCGAAIAQQLLTVTAATTPVVSNATVSLSLCPGSAAKRLDTLLSATDAGVALTETWRVRRAPAHGTLTGFPYIRTSASGLMIPSGLYYTPAVGYAGTDSFYVTVWNGHDSASSKVFVTLTSSPAVAAITGASALTVGAATTLADATTGGVWASSATSKATVNSAGMVTGVGAGSVNISYTVSSACGSTTVLKSMTITNTVPVPTNATALFTLCSTGISKRLDTLLSSTDAGAGLTETWRVRRAPVHGTLTGFNFSTASTGGAVVPTNLFYTATNGYAGSDSFYVTVWNGHDSASSRMYVTVAAVPTVAAITGATTLAVGATTTLTDATVGGTWASGTPGVATITTAGMVTGVSNGIVAINYAVSNSCGAASASRSMTIGVVAVTNIYDYAGNAHVGSGYSTDGAHANTRVINMPSGIAKDRNGNIYFSEQGNNLVRKVDKYTGALTTIAGNATAGYSGDGSAATAAKLNQPAGVAVDRSGNVYIADQSNARIRKVSTTGVITTIAGTGTIGFTADGGAATSANIAMPLSVAVDSSGNVYFAEQNNHRVRKVSTTGILSTVAGNGSAGFSGDGAAATAAGIAYPAGVWVDAAKNIYIADAGNNRIRKVNTSGVISTVAGTSTSGYSGDGGAATAAQLFNPYGVTTDSVGNIYIADRNNHVIRRVATSGSISTVAGTNVAGYNGDSISATTAKMYNPQGVVCDSANLYVADFSNNEVRVIGSVSYFNSIPVVTNPSISFTLCNTSTAKRLDTLLTATDADHGQTNTWRVRVAPAHGTLSGLPYSVSTTGGALIPSSIYYTPTSGYSGTDSFYITVWDGRDSASSKVYVTVGTVPAVAPITGLSVLTISSPITLADATPGGVWSSQLPIRATVAASGVVTGVTTGNDSIKYTVTNACGSRYVAKQVSVTGAREASSLPEESNAEILVYPNPASELLNVDLPEGSGQTTLIIMDMNGKVVLQTSTKDIHVQLGIDNMPGGIYILRIATEKQTVSRKVMIRE